MPNAMPIVSIAMPVRNVERTIIAALRSLVQQTFADWEAIVIDDGSSDRTPDLVRGCGDPRVRLIVEPRNAGIALRLNQAVDLARGRFVARMDGDDICLPRRFERQVAFLQEHPEVDLLGTRTLFFADDGSPHGLSRVATTHKALCAHLWLGIPLPHPTWMGRAAWFRRHRYRIDVPSAEDQELLLRTHESSRFACLDEVLLGYRLATLTLRKAMAGRRSVVQAVAEYAVSQRRYGLIPLVVARQLTKALIEGAAILVGTPDGAIRSRSQGKPLAELVDEWQRCWARCTEASTAAALREI